MTRAERAQIQCVIDGQEEMLGDIAFVLKHEEPVGEDRAIILRERRCMRATVKRYTKLLKDCGGYA